MDPFEKCIDWLKRLGLQEYQAKAYAGTLLKADSFAAEIAKISGVPEPKVYTILKSLEREGFVISSFGRPKRFRAISLESAIDLLIERLVEKIKFMKKGKEEMMQELNEMIVSFEQPKKS
jgi:sugar-specific transcriptional regulator TrmB